MSDMRWRLRVPESTKGRRNSFSGITPPDDGASSPDVVERLDEIRARIQEISQSIATGLGSRDELDEIVAELRAVQKAVYGPPKRAARGEGAKSRILAYLMSRSGQVVSGEELAEISGIQEWARRVRELRVQEGYEIIEIGSGSYRWSPTSPTGIARMRGRPRT